MAVIVLLMKLLYVLDDKSENMLQTAMNKVGRSAAMDIDGIGYGYV